MRHIHHRMNENAISTTYNKKEIDVTTIERKKSSFPVTKKRENGKIVCDNMLDDVLETYTANR